MAEHIERATRLIAGGDYREAVRTCRRALLAHPESIRLRLLLGRGLLAMERFEEVRTEMLAVLRSSPSETRAYRFLGEAYLYDGRPDRAIEAFHRALELDPSDEELKSLLDDAALEEPTAVGDQVVAGSAEITRESLLPKFGEDDEDDLAEATERALPAAVFRERKSGGRTGTSSYSLPPGSLAAPRLPTGVSVPPESAPPPAQPAALSPRASRPPTGVSAPSRSVPPPPPPAALSQRPSHSSKPQKHSPSPQVARQGPHKPAFQKTLLGSPAASEPSVKAPSPSSSLEGFDWEPGDTKDTWNTADAFLSPELDAMEQGLHDRPDTSDFDELPTEVQVSHTASRAAQSQSVMQRSSARPSMPSREPRLAFDEQPVSFEVFSEPPPAAPPPASEFAEELFGDDEETRDRDPLWQAPAAAVPPPSVPPPAEGKQRVKHLRKQSSSAKRWLVRGGVVVVLFALGFGAAALYRIHSRGEALAEAVSVATRVGGKDNYERVISLATNQDATALALRFQAVKAFEYGDTSNIGALRKSLPLLDAQDPQAHAALAIGYVALLDQQPAQTLRVLEPFSVDAEAQYLSSLALLEQGKWDEARKSARSAAQLLPGAARYEAGKTIAEAVSGVEGAPPARDSKEPSVQVAALIHAYMRDGSVDVARTAAVAEQDLTLANRAWARWLLLRAAIDRGQTEQAQKVAATLTSQRAMTALQQVPSPLRLLIANAMLDLGAPQKAKALFDTLPETVRERPEALAAQVQFFLMNDTVDDARALLDKVSGSSPRVALLRARVEVADAKHEAALEVLKGALDDAHTRSDAMLLAAEAYSAQGKWSEAIKMIEPLWKLKPGEADLTRILVSNLLAAERNQDARDVIKKFEDGGGDASTTAVFRARLALDAGNIDEAAQVVQSLPADTTDGAAIKAQVLRRTGDLQGAHKVLETSLKASPSHPGLLQEKVLVSLRLYRFDEAHKAAERLEPSEKRSKTLRAMVEVTQAGGLDALQEMENLRDNTDADLHLYRAFALYHGEKDADARRAFDHVLSLRPNHPDALIGAGLVALRTGGLAKASAHAEAALKVSDEIGDRFKARALALEAKLNYERGGFKQADDLIARALKADRGCALAHLVAASLDEERGKNAVDEFKKATEGHFVMPEALARYALASKKPLCDMANRYLEAAPNGFDAPEMRRIAGKCD